MKNVKYTAKKISLFSCIVLFLTLVNVSMALDESQEKELNRLALELESNSQEFLTSIEKLEHSQSLGIDILRYASAEFLKEAKSLASLSTQVPVRESSAVKSVYYLNFTSKDIQAGLKARNDLASIRPLWEKTEKNLADIQALVPVQFDFGMSYFDEGKEPENLFADQDNTDAVKDSSDLSWIDLRKFKLAKEKPEDMTISYQKDIYGFRVTVDSGTMNLTAIVLNLAQGSKTFDVNNTLYIGNTYEKQFDKPLSLKSITLNTGGDAIVKVSILSN